jgi:hypothetical protein
MIEVRYEGALIGRSAIIRELDTRGLFLGITEPMPVGTPVTLKIGDEAVAGRVAAVSESQELARAGMRVRFTDPRAATLFGTPVEAAPEAEPAGETEATEAPVPASVPAAAPQTAAPAPEPPSAPRRIVIDASTQRPREEAAPAPPPVAEAADEVDTSGPAPGGDERIPAPDALAFGPAKKNRRQKRR